MKLASATWVQAKDNTFSLSCGQSSSLFWFPCSKTCLFSIFLCPNQTQRVKVSNGVGFTASLSSVLFLFLAWWFTLMLQKVRAVLLEHSSLSNKSTSVISLVSPLAAWSYKRFPAFKLYLELTETNRKAIPTSRQKVNPLLVYSHYSLHFFP